MIKKIITFFATLSVIILCLISLCGCSTMNDVVKAKEQGKEGTTKTYPVTADQAWNISKTVFRWEGSDAIEEHHDQNYMLTSSGFNGFTMGTVMGAWIQPIDKNTTQVTVITKRRDTFNAFTTLTEGTFHKRFAEGVAIIKSGKPLPAIAPQ